MDSSNKTIQKLKLSEILLTTKDGDWGKDTQEEGYIPYGVIRGADFPSVRVGDISTVPLRYLNENNVHRRTLIPKDIIIETAGGNRNRPTGRTLLVTSGLIEKFKCPITCASFCRFLRIDPTIAAPEYVFWYLQFMYMRGEMWQHQVQHTGVARFQYTKFADSLEIPLPPLPEQHAIARILGSLDDKIELNRRMNATLEAMAQAIFKSWFVDFDPVRAKMEGREPAGMDAETAALFPDAFEEVDGREVPEGWTLSTIGAEVQVVGGSTPSTKNPAFWDNGSISFATPKDMSKLTSPVLLDTERCITEAGLKTISSGLLPRGTVLLSSRAPIGYLAITEIPVAVNQGFIAMLCNKELSNYYVHYWAQANMERIRAHANGSTFQEISKKNFRPIEVVVPSPEIIQRFNGLLHPIHKQIANNARQSHTLTTLRDTLLPKLISGEIRVPDTMLEAAET